MSRWTLWALVVILSIALAVSITALAVLLPRGGDGAATPAAAASVRYHCPMHPTITSDAPGECPICHMSLVPIEEPGGTQAAGEAQEKDGVPGQAAVRIPLRRQQLIGVRTTSVARVPMRRTIRAVARVTYDETRLHHFHSKISGFVEKLYANTTGQTVRRGQPLFEIFSPDLLATQQEYLLALASRERSRESTLPNVVAAGEELVASARRKLELYDITEDQIRELEETRKARRTLTLHAPMDGTITERMVTHGERIGPESTLLDIADLSRVWVLASVYEHELPLVRVGDRVTMELPYYPGQRFAGTVAFVYPVLDPVTRTAQIRVEFANPDLLLKPDMYAEVVLEADLGVRLVVPGSAIMETGTRSIAFVDKGDGLFEPREVRIGVRADDLREVLDGLAEGEKVVTSANFLIDSESKLKAAQAAMTEDGAGDEGKGRTEPAHGSHP